MDAPLGEAVGNASETREAFEVLHGRGPADLLECTLVLGAEMLVLGGAAKTAQDARKRLEAAIASGAGVRVMERMVEAQHGDPHVVADPSLMPSAPEKVAVEAPRKGVVADIDALAIGLAAVAMGAGRTRADQAVDPLVGIEVVAKPGQAVERGDAVARLHVRTRAAADAVADRVASAFSYADVAPATRALVLGRIV
jgi:pyrimidine-nucleoside phosphorylase